MKRTNEKRFLAIVSIVITFSLMLSIVALADDETTVPEKIEIEQKEETIEETVVTSDPVIPTEEKSVGVSTEESDENEGSLTDTIDTPMTKLATIRNRLEVYENNEEYNIKELYNTFKGLETDEERSAYYEKLTVEQNKALQEYVELKKEEENLLSEIAKLAETDPEAAAITGTQQDIDFAEAELKAAEEELAAMGLEAEKQNIDEDEGLNQKIDIEGSSETCEITEESDDAVPEGVSEEKQENDKEETKNESVVDDAETKDAAAEEVLENQPESDQKETESSDKEIDEEEKEISEESAELEDVDSKETVQETEKKDEAQEKSDPEEETSDEYDEEKQEIITEDSNIDENAEVKPEPKASVSIWFENLSGEKIQVGDTLCIHASVDGFDEDMTVTYQWERSADGENWEAIDGATELDYTYVIDLSNCGYSYRLSATY